MTRLQPRAAALAVLVALCAAAPASAGDPIMPLGEVQKGMRCTAYSVLQGVDISSFDAEVVDVVAGDPVNESPRILMRFSGPAIERTGVGPGFSGSPIYCDGRVIGAISEAVGEYGGLVALATPIESILGTPVDPPPGTKAAPGRTRSLAGPITVSGLSPRVADMFRRAARRAGGTFFATPGQPRQDAFPFQQLRPGASLSAGLAGGDLTAGSVGTVSYVDGDRVWGFGHPLDGAGRRSLFLQDAYVYSVIGNPVGLDNAGTYKLAAPGHDVGILSSDGNQAVAGRLGRLPDAFGMKVIARDQDTGRQRVLRLHVADEAGVDFPTGGSALAIAGAGAVAQAAATILGAPPARQTGELCARIEVRERKEPLRFCNRYVTREGAEDTSEQGSLGASGAMASDFAEAAIAVDDYDFGELHVTGVEANIKLRRGLRLAYLLSGSPEGTVRPGGTARLRVRAKQVRGPEVTRTVKVPIPAGTSPGRRTITLTGTPADSAAGLDVDLSELLGGSDDEEGDGGPRSVDALARTVERISRYDGVRAHIGDETERVLRDPALRLSGEIEVRVTVAG